MQTHVLSVLRKEIGHHLKKLMDQLSSYLIFLVSKLITSNAMNIFKYYQNILCLDDTLSISIKLVESPHFLLVDSADQQFNILWLLL